MITRLEGYAVAAVLALAGVGFVFYEGAHYAELKKAAADARDVANDARQKAEDDAHNESVEQTTRAANDQRISDMDRDIATLRARFRGMHSANSVRADTLPGAANQPGIVPGTADDVFTSGGCEQIKADCGETTIRMRELQAQCANGIAIIKEENERRKSENR